MDKRAIYAMLARRGVWHEATEHAAVFNMAEASALTLPYPEAEAKNLFCAMTGGRTIASSPCAATSAWT